MTRTLIASALLATLAATAHAAPATYAIVRYDLENDRPVRDHKGYLEKVGKGEPGLLISEISAKWPFDGYTDPAKSESVILRDVFKKGDAWFNTGDLMRDIGCKHAQFVDRLGDTFRWKGENVATTEVEAALERLPQVQDCAVYGVEVPGSDGRAGMAAVVLREDFDSSDVAGRLAEMLPKYAVPLFMREVESLEQTSTFKSRKVELRDAGYAGAGDDRVWVLTKEGYVPFYEGYPEDVAGARQP